MRSTDDSPGQRDASRRNQRCVCVTLDRQALAGYISDQLGDGADDILSSEAWHQLFSDVAVFVERQDLNQMRAMVAALEAAVALPEYQAHVLSRAPAAARYNPGPVGVFMGYDFHLGMEGPRLIEINTNAGGAFINSVLARAQRQCCGGTRNETWTEGFDRAVIDQFESEWRAQYGGDGPATIAIVDKQPWEQHLFPEFKLAQRLLQNSGIETVILSPEELDYEAGVLYGNGKRIDLVYNRLVDFGFEAPEHTALRSAWLHQGAVITPNPRAHALFADKRNLAVLSDPVWLENRGLSSDKANLLRQCVPQTVWVTPDNADELWRERRKWFFKPVSGHGSKGVYRGSKLTTKTFARIVENDYIAQAHVPPSERQILVDGERENLKIDVRLYTYRGDLILAAARLYRGQTTNFRTEGGGFAPLLVT